LTDLLLAQRLAGGASSEPAIVTMAMPFTEGGFDFLPEEWQAQCLGEPPLHVHCCFLPLKGECAFP
jgi:hypothetical protein